jgi:hypothetical protein
MTKYRRGLLAVALVLALVGLGAVYGTGVRNHSRSVPASAACGREQLSQRRILLLRRGPLTQTAAKKLLCAEGRR